MAANFALLSWLAVAALLRSNLSSLLRKVDGLDTSLETFPAAAYGARWGLRSEEEIKNMSKMAMVVLMQEDGECWTRCCSNITGTVIRNASGLVVSGECGPIHNATALPGCSADCDQHGKQLAVFQRMKDAAKADGRRAPHCVLYMNADYLWPYDQASSQGDAIRIVDIHGKAHVETCDPVSHSLPTQRFVFFAS